MKEKRERKRREGSKAWVENTVGEEVQLVTMRGGDRQREEPKF